MGLMLDENASPYAIRAYEPGRIQINNDWLTHSVLIYPNKLDCDCLPETIDGLTLTHLQRIYPHAVSILLIGTGTSLRFPAIEMYAELLTKGIGVEVMDTRAACRTFQVLSGEGRAVAALLCIR